MRFRKQTEKMNKLHIDEQWAREGAQMARDRADRRLRAETAPLRPNWGEALTLIGIGWVDMAAAVMWRDAELWIQSTLIFLGAMAIGLGIHRATNHWVNK